MKNTLITNNASGETPWAETHLYISGVTGDMTKFINRHNKP